MEILVNSIGKRDSFLGSEVSKGKEDKMKKREIIAVMGAIIGVICLIVVPRVYYQTHSATSTIDIVNAIYTAAAIEVTLLGGLIMSIRK